MNKAIVVTGVAFSTDVPMKIVINVEGRQETASETLKTVMEERESN